MKMATIPVMIAVVVILLSLLSGIVADFVNQEDDDLYVFVLTGQSNAAYYNYNVNAANEELQHIPEGMAFYYGTASAPIYYGTLLNPTYDDTFTSYGFQDAVGSNGKYVIGNIEAPFMSEFVNKTGKHIYIINTAISGQSIGNMASGSAGDLYAKDVFDHAMSVIPSNYKIKMASLLFIQGESDSETSVSDYKTDFISMFDSYRSFANIDKVIISETRSSDGGNASIAQIELTEEYSNIYMGSTAAVDFINGTRYMAADGLHYSQYGDNVIGVQLADCFISNLYSSTADLLQFMNILPVIVIICVVSAMLFVIIRAFNRD